MHTSFQRLICAAFALGLAVNVSAQVSTTRPRGQRPVEEPTAESPSREGLGGAGLGMLFDLLQRLDVNNDRKISLREFQVIPRLGPERFKMLDRDGDGFITLREIQVPELLQRGEGDLFNLLRGADLDHDQKVSREEFEKMMPRAPVWLFTSLDRNGDGSLSPEDAAEGGPRSEIGDAAVDESPQLRYLKAYDRNGDGKLSYRELERAKPGFPRASFDELDKNKDGIISRADLPKPPRPTRTSGDRNTDRNADPGKPARGKGDGGAPPGRALGRDGNAPGRAVGITEKGAPGTARGIQGNGPSAKAKAPKGKANSPKPKEDAGAGKGKGKGKGAGKKK